MLDRENYRKDCARLTLGREKMEEIIAMTENTPKKGLRRPVKIALIAAACVAALSVTAMAAPAVQQLFTTFTITYRDSNTQTAFVVPTLTLEEREGRDILTVDGEETDVTDAFAEDGQYAFTVDQADITVKRDGWVEITMAGDEESGPITYTFQLQGEAPITSVDSPRAKANVVAEDGLEDAYLVTADESGAIDVTPAQ